MQATIEQRESGAVAAGRAGVAGEFEFTSAVDASLLKDVESLFYFHPRQHALIGSIRESVDEFGPPEILKRGERIYVGIPKRDAQCLFACHRTRRPGVPVGVVLYLRTQADLLRILHVVVGPNYAYGGPHADCDLAACLVEEVRRVAARIGGVRRIALPYRRERYLSVAPHGAG